MTRQKVIENFNKDIKTHVMTIVRDERPYRHLKFRAADGSCHQAFEIVTWPGYLAYVGDMGSYVFSRIEDMFEFFRRPVGTVQTDLGYWSEKCVAEAKHGGIRKFSADAFEQAIRDEVSAQIDDQNYLDGIVSEIMNRHNGGARSMESTESAYDFMSGDFSDVDADGRTFNLNFENFYECSIEDYTGWFQWCCLALPWAIQQYDAANDLASKGEAR